MLVLTRSIDESIVINGDIIVTVVEVRGDKVRLGITAPMEIPVHRSEVQEAISDWRSDEYGDDEDDDDEPTENETTTGVHLTAPQTAFLDAICESLERQGGEPVSRDTVIGLILAGVREMGVDLCAAADTAELVSMLRAARHGAEQA